MRVLCVFSFVCDAVDSWCARKFNQGMIRMKWSASIFWQIKRRWFMLIEPLKVVFVCDWVHVSVNSRNVYPVKVNVRLSHWLLGKMFDSELDDSVYYSLLVLLVRYHFEKSYQNCFWSFNPAQLHLYCTFDLQPWVTVILLLVFRLATCTVVFELHGMSTFTLCVLETLYITNFLAQALLTVKDLRHISVLKAFL